MCPSVMVVIALGSAGTGGASAVAFEPSLFADERLDPEFFRCSDPGRDEYINDELAFDLTTFRLEYPDFAIEGAVPFDVAERIDAISLSTPYGRR